MELKNTPAVSESLIHCPYRYRILGMCEYVVQKGTTSWNLWCSWPDRAVGIPAPTDGVPKVLLKGSRYSSTHEFTVRDSPESLSGGLALARDVSEISIPLDNTTSVPIITQPSSL